MKEAFCQNEALAAFMHLESIEDKDVPSMRFGLVLLAETIKGRYFYRIFTQPSEKVPTHEVFLELSYLPCAPLLSQLASF
jgi:hypothetical protein